MILRTTGFQMALTALIVGLATWVTGANGIRTGWNIAWMIGVPAMLALALNPDRGSRAMMAFALVGCALATVAGVTIFFGFGPD